MKIVSRYIMGTIISSILLILLVLMGIELLVSFIGQMSDIGVGNYGLTQAIKFIALDMPYQVYILFPMAGLVGSLLGLGLLANQSELIIMRSAGFSTGQIARTTLKAAFIMVLIVTILGEVVAPYTEHIANVSKAVATSKGQALNTGNGTWIRNGNHFIYIHSILTKHHLLDVTDYQFNNKHQLVSARSAKHADYKNGKWFLRDVKSSNISPNNVTSKSVSKQVWDVSLEPDILSISNDEPRNMSLVKLNSYIDYLESNGLRSATYELNFWTRIIRPLATIIMILFAIPFVFGSIRSVTMGVRVLTGVTVGFGFYILNQFFGPLSMLYQLPPLLGAMLPTSIFVFVGFVLLWRMR